MRTRDLMLIGAGALLGVAGAVGYVEYRLAGRAAPAVAPSANRLSDVYAPLAAARNDAEMYMALANLYKLRGPQEPLPHTLARKAFAWARREKHDGAIFVGHLAAIAGDAELLRETVHTYFGCAEGEAKCGYVEEFLQCHPELFFSLPDTWQLWRAAGGPECCNDPSATVPILIRFADSTRDAQRILGDVRDAASRGEYAQTEWGKQTRAALAQQ